MSREIILEALNGLRDEYITEAGTRLGLVAVGAAAAGSTGVSAPSAGTVPTADRLFSLSAPEAPARAGFGAWLSNGGWIALTAGVLVAAGVAVGAFFLGKSGDVPPVDTDDVTAAKRNRELTLSLDELEACIPAAAEDADRLAGMLNDFLEGLDETNRVLFMGRYWYSYAIDDLAERMGLTQRAVYMRLHKTREKLRAYLTERGYRV